MAEAVAIPRPALNLAPRTQIQVKVQDIKLENLMAVVERISKLTGCTGCGLLGVDLRILGGDPATNPLTNIPGVTSVGPIAE